MPMGSETLSGLNRFFPELLDCICFSVLAGRDIQRGSLRVMQKAVFFLLVLVLLLCGFFVLLCFVVFCFFFF